MNYDKLSRSIRQYYKKGIIKKTEHSKRLVYQFCKPYLSWDQLPAQDLSQVDHTRWYPAYRKAKGKRHSARVRACGEVTWHWSRPIRTSNSFWLVGCQYMSLLVFLTERCFADYIECETVYKLMHAYKIVTLWKIWKRWLIEIKKAKLYSKSAKVFVLGPLKDKESWYQHLSLSMLHIYKAKLDDCHTVQRWTSQSLLTMYLQNKEAKCQLLAS